MIGKKEAMESLKPGLTKAIQGWMDNSASDTDEWAALEIWVGDNLAGLMSDAAIAVLGGLVDSQEYLLANNLLVEA